jgi:hypothetical protein
MIDPIAGRAEAPLRLARALPARPALTSLI